MEEVIMELIIKSGSARSSAIEAIQYAKAGDIAKAEQSFQQAKEDINLAHRSQTDLIQGEIRGEETPINLLMVHAQDHLMTALVVIDLAEEFIDLYRKINN